MPHADPRPTVRVVAARSSRDLARVRALFEEYARSLPVDLGFQGFAEELRTLPGEYAPPQGALFLARCGARSVGCVGVRPLPGGVGEMKRLYVRPSFRGRGVGRVLADRAVRAARERGYRSLRLDTLAGMTSAVALYRSLGFAEIPPYRYNPVPGARFFELVLVPLARRPRPRRGTTK